MQARTHTSTHARNTRTHATHARMHELCLPLTHTNTQTHNNSVSHTHSKHTHMHTKVNTDGQTQEVIFTRRYIYIYMLYSGVEVYCTVGFMYCGTLRCIDIQYMQYSGEDVYCRMYVLCSSQKYIHATLRPGRCILYFGMCTESVWKQRPV